jgi:DNA ligase-1
MSMFKPLLAHTIENTGAISYPCLASVKLDGIRCIVVDGVAMSRSMKPIRNKYVQACIGKPEYNNLDGELVVGGIYAKDCYRNTNSGVMSEDGEPEFTFHVFDRVDMPTFPFLTRYTQIPSLRFVQIVPHWEIETEYALLDLEQEYLEKGAEGIMVRSITGQYKQGRSTVKAGILGKLKRFVDDDFVVIGFEERLHNGNIATINALGRTERSSHQENKTGRGDLGAIICQGEGFTFNCGSGFNDEQRAEIWENREDYLGRVAKIKHFEIGVKTSLRFPTFLGWRHQEDMSK